MKKGFTKTRHSDEQSEEESNKLDRSFAVAQDDRLREGFTLVELSIVLVIIGLLISGLLVGQSMIKAAKVQAQVKQFQQFDILIRNFKEVYRYVPGDLPNATAYFGAVSGSCNTVAGTGTQSCNGDGDGIIDYVNTDNTLHESWRAWEHLSHADFFQTEYTGIYGTSCTYGSICIVPGTNIPEAEIGESTGLTLFRVRSSWSPWGVLAEDRHIYSLGSSANTVAPANEGVWHGRGLTPAEALAIDVKADDGGALTGEIVMMNGAGYGLNCSGGDYTAPANYDTSYSDPSCNLLVNAGFDD